MEKMVNDILAEVRKSALELKTGGPFGAVVYKNGEIVGKGVNRVLDANDPTAHAEIVAIRNACQKLKTHDLTGCELYATGQPCPMCLSAIIWANIKKVYFSCDVNDAEAIGFRDKFIFDFLKENCLNKNIVVFEQVEKKDILELYKEFNEMKGTIY